MVLLRQIIGETLRSLRQTQHRTLRDVAAAANVSLGYLSEVERGQKEPSSELLSSICEALDIPLSLMLEQVRTNVAREEEPAAEMSLPKVTRLDEHRKVAEMSIPDSRGAAESESDRVLTPPVSLSQARARRARGQRGGRSAAPKASLVA